MKICLLTKKEWLVKSSHGEHLFTDLFKSFLKLCNEVACLLSAGSPFHILHDILSKMLSQGDADWWH